MQNWFLLIHLKYLSFLTQCYLNCQLIHLKYLSSDLYQQRVFSRFSLGGVKIFLFTHSDGLDIISGRIGRLIIWQYQVRYYLYPDQIPDVVYVKFRPSSEVNKLFNMAKKVGLFILFLLEIDDFPCLFVNAYCTFELCEHSLSNHACLLILNCKVLSFYFKSKQNTLKVVFNLN
jgi:hypothetical protein